MYLRRNDDIERAYLINQELICRNKISYPADNTFTNKLVRGKKERK
jgi:hypothetical protein